MHAQFLDRYARLDTPVHRLPAGLKLSAAIAAVIGISLLPIHRPLLLAIAAVVLLGVTLAARIPLLYLLRRLLLLEPLVIGVVALAAFGPGGPRLMALLLARCTLSLWTVILLANTTPFSDLLIVLQKVRVPSLLVTTLALMYRYLFVLVSESQRMRRARASRTFTTGRRFQWHTMAGVAGQLFLRASDRAERIYAAMCARGWR